jgi:hypothetical protein
MASNFLFLWIGYSNVSFASMMHVGLGRAHPLHVEYIHLGVCLSFIQDILTEAILSHPRLHLQRKIEIVKALGKVIWIQNDLFAKWHVKDGDEFKSDDTEIVIEQEGYLHGKKVIDGSDGEDFGNAKAQGVCPFSGVAKGMSELKVGTE